MHIPKIIHYCWLSTNPWDKTYGECFKSWSQFLPGYQFRLWDARRKINSGFYNKMLKKGKWAFASDYLRLYALYHQGGIYMDLDVQVLKNFDALLENDCFIAREDAQYIAGHILGARPKHPFIKKCLDYYDNSIRLKINSPPTIPRIITAIALKQGLNREDRNQSLKDNTEVYASTYFSPLHYSNRLKNNPQGFASDLSYCLHHWQHGWSWLASASLLTLLKNQPWLFMNKEDWKRLIKNIYGLK